MTNTERLALESALTAWRETLRKRVPFGVIMPITHAEHSRLVWC